MDTRPPGHAPVWRWAARAAPTSSDSDLDPGSWAPAPGSRDEKDGPLGQKSAGRYQDHDTAYRVLVGQELRTWALAVPAGRRGRGGACRSQNHLSRQAGLIRVDVPNTEGAGRAESPLLHTRGTVGRGRSPPAPPSSRPRDPAGNPAFLRSGRGGHDRDTALSLPRCRSELSGWWAEGTPAGIVKAEVARADGATKPSAAKDSPPPPSAGVCVPFHERFALSNSRRRESQRDAQKARRANSVGACASTRCK